MRNIAWFRIIALGGGLAFLYVPILVVIAYSFNDSRLVTVWSHPSLRWYEAVFQNDQIISAATLSLWIAAVSATLATALGFVAAFTLNRMKASLLKRTYSGLTLLPIMLPDVLVGFALLLVMAVGAGALGLSIPRGPATLIAAHTTLGFAYAATLLRASIGRADASVAEAAADLGAPPLAVMLRVVVPSQLPAIAAAWLISFLLSLDDVIISSFVTGPGYSTLPMVVFSSMRLGLSPQINALTSVLFAFVTTIIVVSSIVLMRYGRSLQGDGAPAHQ